MVMIEYLAVILRNGRKIIAISIGCALFMFILATILPKEYKAKAIGIIAVGSGKGSGALSGILADLPVPSFMKSGFSSTEEQLDIIKTIIDSDLMRYRVIYHFKYDSIFTKGKNVRKPKAKEIYLKKINKYIKTEITDENAIIVTIRDRSPKRAADVANYIISQADSILNQLSMGNAQKRAEFFEIQIQLQKARLNAAEDSLRAYQEKNKVALPEEQATATIEASVDMDGKIMGAEINLGLLRQKFQENHPSIVETKQLIAKLKEKRNQMVNNLPDNVLFPLSNLPRTMVEYGRLYRDFKIQQAVYQTMVPELENAKIEQYKNIPSIQFIENATLPERRSYPPRFIWTMLGFSLGLCVSVTWACFKEYKIFLDKNDRHKSEIIEELFASFLSIFKIAAKLK